MLDAADAAVLFDDTVTAILRHGGSGQSLWVGPAGAADDPSRYGLNLAKMDLRIDIDVDLDRAALTWQPDGSVAIELEPGPSLTVIESVDAAALVVTGTRARVSAATARAAFLEYAATGKRPTCVEWAPAES
ncbi:Imm1 family immunity protein [Virgisporangium aurantiacum]|uniref:Imm1 family immunity protein n=1 Tax=Virgisporangium aurantiacum TaxID=175570 RepID=UPI001951DE6C|nr:Imm1 family immunity protein [Virgisporangium aurantiacum]